MLEKYKEKNKLFLSVDLLGNKPIAKILVSFSWPLSLSEFFTT